MKKTMVMALLLAAVLGLSACVPHPQPAPTPPLTPAAEVTPAMEAAPAVTPAASETPVPAAAEYRRIDAAGAKARMDSGDPVIVLDVPTTKIEVAPGLWADPVSLLAALDQYGTIHLALEPAAGLNIQSNDVVTLNLGDLYETLNENRGKK